MPRAEVVVAVRNKKTGEEELFRALLDTGTSRSLATVDAITRTVVQMKPSIKKHSYRTALGIFETAKKAKLKSHRLVELSAQRTLKGVQVQVAKSLGQYDFIFGTDYLTKFGIDLKFSDRTIVWDGIE